MKIREKIKKGYVIALAVLMLLSCISLMQAQAAGGIDPDADCSLTISVDINGNADGSTTGNADYLNDFNQMKISVPVYKVADVDVTGQKFTPVEAFQTMDFSIVAENPSSVTAGTWMDLAEEAAKILEEDSSIEPVDTVEVEKPENGTTAVGMIEGLKPGMYLVAPEACYNPDYTVLYKFTPYLTALPSSEYTLSGSGSDDWVYDTTIGLKPDAELLYGKLKIIKNLKNYNATLGDATFVFRIVGIDKNGDVKYDEMESLTFTEAGSTTITLEKIPAGLDITVTEVYSGASYKIEGSDKQNTVIWADAAIAAGAAGAQEAAVSFTNIYDGGNRSGYGVTNHFEDDGNKGWTWTKNPKASAGE